MTQQVTTEIIEHGAPVRKRGRRPKAEEQAEQLAGHRNSRGEPVPPKKSRRRPERRTEISERDAAAAKKHVQVVPTPDQIIYSNQHDYTAAISGLSKIERFVYCQDAAYSDTSKEYQLVRLSVALMFFMSGRAPSVVNIMWIDILTNHKTDAQFYLRVHRRQRRKDAKKSVISREDYRAYESYIKSFQEFEKTLRSINFDVNESEEAKRALGQLRKGKEEAESGGFLSD